MGRTVPTYRTILETKISEWNDFKRALRGNDKKAFDRLMNKARKHASASTYDIRPDPIESIFMSILLEFEKEIEELRRKIEEKE